MSEQQSETLDPDPVLLAAWTAGKIVIVATLADGPSAGGSVMCCTPRENMRVGIKKAHGAMHKSGFRHSLVTAIRQQVQRGVGDLAPANDQDFMDDLVILACVKLARGGDDGVLDGTGLFSLLLAVSPDTSAPWFQRGLLYKADAALPMSTLD